ncbi:MAG: HNH endonuclease [Pyrinomonadaceae bacterium]|nr:HNH endonuclease [Blastocatellia bacterium]MCW5957368.1 HNH endonuclease [Pyrinomonadaceae bacterium]
MNHFTTYWKNSTWEYNQKNLEDTLLDHTASENFLGRVEPGDAVYVVTNLKGKLYVACKIIVDEICDRKRASELVGTTDLWDSSDHIIAAFSTKMDWNRKIPDAVTRKLEFYGPERSVKNGLKFSSAGILDGQTLRGNRMLTESSAILLDSFLGKMFPIAKTKAVKGSVWEDDTDSDVIETEFESAAEGAPGKRRVTYYERKKANRNEAIRIHGVDCKGCEINFEKTYGPLGKDFIHVHHTVPVSQYEKSRKVDIRNEMTVLCPNCHAMVHRNKKRTLSVADLRALLGK